MTRMTGPDCVVMCDLINTYIHTYVAKKRKKPLNSCRRQGGNGGDLVERGRDVEKEVSVQ